MRDFLLNALVLGGILGASAFITHWFAHHMYVTCRACGTMNARRRSACRGCSKPLA